MKKFDYCNGIVHSVKKGDTLYTLSRQYDIPLALLLRANPYVDIYNMQVGDEICIPFDFLTTPGTTPSNQTPSMPTQMPSMPTQMPSMSNQMPSMSNQMPSRPAQFQTPGTTLPVSNNPTAPACQNSIYYVVKENDTLASVLDYFALELSDLLNCNTMDTIRLLPGSKLQITLKEDTEEETE